MRYFVSGVAFPDLTVVSADFLTEGNEALVVTGFWDSQWKLENADVKWQEE